MKTCLLTAVVVMLAGWAAAGQLEDAAAAYQRKDYATAMKLFRPLAEQGQVHSQAIVAKLYWSGLGVPQSNAEGAKWYRKAAEQGFAPAQNMLGLAYAEGKGVPKDIVQAYRWWLLAAAGGDKDAPQNLKNAAGDMTPAQIAQAKRQAGSKSESGSASSSKSESTEANGSAKPKAGSQTQAKAAKGKATVDDAVAAMQRHDYATALRILRPLAEQGDATAQLNLGVMYANGQGVPQNNAEAVKWTRKAAERGAAPGQELLGDMYMLGALGLPKNYAEAAKWYRKAAEQGSAQGQNNLGTRYALGQGVPKDPVQAYKWYSLAAAKGYKTSVENRAKAATELTPAQRAQAERLVREWKPTKTTSKSKAVESEPKAKGGTKSLAAPTRQGSAAFAGTWIGTISLGILGDVSITLTVNPEATSVTERSREGESTHPATYSGDKLSWNSGWLNDITLTLTPASDGKTAAVTARGFFVNGAAFFRKQ